MINIKIIVGSIRERRFAEKVLPWVIKNLENNNQENKFTFQVLDLKDWDIPFFAEGMSPMFIKNFDYRLDIIKKLSSEISSANGFILIAPEYNHGISSVLKNAMDYLFKEWQYKPFGIVSYGEVGGANMIQSLRLVGIELKMIPVKYSVNIMNPWELKDKEGNLIEGSLEKYNPQFEAMLKDILFLCDKMK